MADRSRESDPVLDALDASTRYEIEQARYALDRLERRASVRWDGGLGRRQSRQGGRSLRLLGWTEATLALVGCATSWRFISPRRARNSG